MLLVRHDSVTGDGRLHIFCNRSETTFYFAGTLKTMQILPSKVLYPPKKWSSTVRPVLNERVAVLWPNITVFPIKYKTRVFKIRGGDIDCSHDNIAYDESTGLLQVSTSTIRSPIHKMAKISTPTKSVHKILFSDMPLTEEHSFVRKDSMGSEH